MKKLGPHIIRSTDEAVAYARSTSIVKQVDNIVALQAAPPGAITVFRHYFPSQDVWRDGEDVAKEILIWLGGYRPTYVELYNETAQRVGEGLAAHIRMTARAVPLFHEAGIKVAGYSFSTGVPEPRDWLCLQKERWGEVDAVAIHEYWGNQGFTGWNALRYRKVHEWTGGQHPPFIITECGRDAVENGQAGWKISGVSAEQYKAELDAYDAELKKDDYVLGGTIFTASPTEDWRNFDIDALGLSFEQEEVPVPDKKLAELFPEVYDQWLKDGGDSEGDFRRFLWGTGRLTVGRVEWEALTEYQKSLAEDTKQIGLRHF